MSVDLSRVAKEFDLTEKELEKKSLEAFLLVRLREYESERRSKCSKWGVKTLEDMNRLVEEDKISETDILEDLQDVDYLTYKISQIRDMLKGLRNG